MGIDFAHLGMESGISFEGVYECNLLLPQFLVKRYANLKGLTFFGLKQGQDWKTGRHTPSKNTQQHPNYPRQCGRVVYM